MKITRRRILITIFVLYCVALFAILFLRNGSDLSFSISDIAERFKVRGNLIPFKTIDSYLTALENGNVSHIVVRNNIVGNFLLFLPMGAFIPFIFKSRKYLLTSLSILVIILSVEVLQLLTGLGSFDVDDIILNFSGSIVGTVLAFIASKIIKNTDR